VIDLYTAPTPEGWKVSIALEELRLPYIVHPVDACSDPQLAPDFLRIRPCGCVPAIVDRTAGDHAVIESRAILLYLADKTGRLMPRDEAGRARVEQWLATDLANPLSGAVSAVTRRVTSDPAGNGGASRSELRALFARLDAQLQANEYLAGDFSIADIAQWACVRMHAWSGIDMTPYRALARWIERISAREACRRGVSVPRPFEPAEQVYRVKSILLR
jgi:GST-like protein